MYHSGTAVALKPNSVNVMNIDITNDFKCQKEIKWKVWGHRHRMGPLEGGYT